MQNLRDQQSLGAHDLNLIELIGLQLGGKGTFLFSGTGDNTGLNLRNLQINEDAVFTALEDEDGQDLLTILGIAGNTCAAGSIIKPINNKKISRIELTSGTVWGIK